jgi:hypothetical protein
MDDMNAFERQVAGAMSRSGGPVRPVDDLAIFTAVTADAQSPKWRFQSMFSATKFVVAGVIVALFGGFLLSGVLTQPSDEQLPAVGASASAQAEPTDATTRESEPTAELEADGAITTPDLLPGVDLVTEEVGFGAYRVLGDGVRDLSKQVRDVVVTPEGNVWIETGTSRNWSLIRLGDPSVSRKLGRQNSWTLGLTSDGVPAVRGGSDEIRVFDGEAWPKAELTAYDECVVAPSGSPAVVGADGGCWRQVRTRELRPSDTALVRLNADGTRTETTRAEVGLEPDHHAGNPVVGPDGTIWVEVHRHSQDEKGGGYPFDGLLAYDGSTWSSIPYDGDEFLVYESEIAVDRDGAVWFSGSGGVGRAILSWDGESWVSHMTAGYTDGFEDGWFTVHPIRPWPNGVVWFGNVARWDGSDLEVFEQPADPLPRPPIYGPVATAPDGSAWTIMEEQLYVITPESVAATE